MTVYSSWLDRLSKYAGLPCIEDGSASFTYLDLLAEVRNWTAHLKELHLQPNTVIALRCDYSIFSIAAVLAMLSEHLIIALVPKGAESGSFVGDTNAQYALELSSVGVPSWRQLPIVGCPSPLVERLHSLNAGGLIVFTSGSSGAPKAALHSIDAFLRKFHVPGRRLRTLAFLLMDHIAGLDTLFYTLTAGGALILTRSRLPLPILELIQSHSIEVLPTSPTFLRLLCAVESIDKFDLSALKVITFGSELMDGRTLARLRRIFPHAQLLQKYGTTELGSPRSISRDGNSLWIKFHDDGVETKVVDGILWMRSDRAILGYLNAELTVDREGWYCTGDRVEIDGDWMRFLGRASDVINVGGEKVSPAEVEEVLSEFDVVEDSLVYGEAHELMGQVVCARIALSVRMGDREARSLIQFLCRQRLPLFKVPMRIEFVNTINVSERQKKVRVWRGGGS